MNGLLDRALTSEVERQLKTLTEAGEGMYRISLLRAFFQYACSVEWRARWLFLKEKATRHPAFALHQLEKCFKHEPKDFSYGELRQEVERRKFFQPLFEFGQTFLASAGLSNESVKYYASLVQFYTVFKLQRMAVPTVRLYSALVTTSRNFLRAETLHTGNDEIANAIIYYNTLLLSRVYEQKPAAGDLEAVKVLKSTSPVAWRNVNLIGNFDFTSSSTPVDIEALAARYQNDDFWLRSMTEGMMTAQNSGFSQLSSFEGLGKNSQQGPFIAPTAKRTQPSKFSNYSIIFIWAAINSGASGTYPSSESFCSARMA
jgi:hypothetical protein